MTFHVYEGHTHSFEHRYITSECPLLRDSMDAIEELNGRTRSHEELFLSVQPHSNPCKSNDGYSDYHHTTLILTALELWQTRHDIDDSTVQPRSSFGHGEISGSHSS